MKLQIPATIINSRFISCFFAVGTVALSDSSDSIFFPRLIEVSVEYEDFELPTIFSTHHVEDLLIDA